MADLIERYKITANLPSVLMNYCNRFNSKQLESITEMIYELENSIESADVQPVDRWISCKDKMPEDRTLVLFCYVNEKGLKSVHYGYHFNINGITAWAKPSGGLNYCDEEITHWQPLPEPPKDGEQNG